MKRPIPIFVFLCVASMAAAQEYPWFWHTEGNALKGQVKEVRGYEFGWGSAPGDTNYYCYTFAMGGRTLTEFIDDVSRFCHNTYYWSHHLDSIVRDGDCTSVEYYLYDSTDRIVQVIHGTPGNFDTTTIIYDGRGFPVTTRGDFDSQVNEPWYEWYDDGRIKGMGSKYWGKHYEYDTLGRMVKETQDGRVVLTFTYNDYGDVAQIKEDPKGNTCYNHGLATITNYTYKYDSHGNWVELYRNGKLETIRTITYFDSDVRVLSKNRFESEDDFDEHE